MKINKWAWMVMAVSLANLMLACCVMGDELPGGLKAMGNRYDQGVDLLQAGKQAEALSAFQEALTGAEKDGSTDGLRLAAAAANNAGNILLLQGQSQAAETYFRRAIKSNPQHALAINNLGGALLRQGRTDEALKAFQQAIAVDAQLALPYVNMAEVLIELRQIKKAAEYLLVAIRLEPKNPRNMMLLVRLYDLGNLPAERQKAWRALVELSGQAPGAQAGLIGDLIRQGHVAQAEQSLAEAQRAHPESLELQLQQACLWAVQGRTREAVEALRGLLKKYPADVQTRSDLAAVLLQAGQTAEAILEAREGTSQYPHEAELWFVLGAGLEAGGQNEEAAKAYHQAVDIKPKHARAWNNLGVLTAKQNQAQEAVKCFERAMAADPFYVDPQYNLGRALVITKLDHERGIRLLVNAGMHKGTAAEKARNFIKELQQIAGLTKGSKPAAAH